MNLIDKMKPEYYGKIVATPSFKDRKVIAYGETHEEASDNAKKAGYENAVLIYVPKPNEKFMFVSSELERKVA